MKKPKQEQPEMLNLSTMSMDQLMILGWRAREELDRVQSNLNMVRQAIAQKANESPPVEEPKEKA